MNELMWLFIIPFIASALIFLFAGLSEARIKLFGILLSFIPLVMLLAGPAAWIGASVQYAWMPAISIEFYLQVDGLSLAFLYLVAVIVPVSLLATLGATIPFSRAFYGFVLLLQGLLIGFFTARDLVVFTFFWEAMLLPLYFIITLWGGSQRQAAAFKFLLYMIAGSALMVAGVLALYFTALAQGTGTFNLEALSKISPSMPYVGWIAAIFMLAFAVKTPLFPFHAWLPDAYCEAPTGGTILLSALLSKAGIYGIARIGLGLFPTIIQAWSPWLLGLAIAGVFYGALAAWQQKDFKRLIAYSSLSHVNFILVGLFIWSQTAHMGAILQALNHGVTIAALFLSVGWLEDRLGTTQMNQTSGMAKFLPHLCWFTLLFVLSGVALPGTNNFIGELLILFGLFGEYPWLTAFLALSVILSVVYMLRWMQEVYFEEPHFFQDNWVDMKRREMAIAIPLVALIMWVGIYPMPLLNFISAPSNSVQVAVEVSR